MIITKTPLRVSLVGGGTDFPAFYRNSFGAVVSMAINKYVYVAINPKFDGKTRVSYSVTENVGHPMELKHDIIRESLMHYGVSGVEVVTMADIPGNGTGLGSSSALAVGMVNALVRFLKHDNMLDENAEYAYEIERNQCLHTVGKQDHYAATFGNLHMYQFNPDDFVVVRNMGWNDEDRAEFESHLTLLWTGRNRRAQDILQAQEANMTGAKSMSMEQMRDIAILLYNDLKIRDFRNVGDYMHLNWQHKRTLAQGITNDWIDDKYSRAISAGAKGGKLCGAGGGGFFLFWGEPGIAPLLENATGLKSIPFKIDTQGSRVIYDDQSSHLP